MSFNINHLLPQEGICHKVRKIPKPDDWDDLPLFHERTDKIDLPTRPQVQDTVILWHDREKAYYEIKALVGR
jgi:hypothetical protein